MTPIEVEKMQAKFTYLFQFWLLDKLHNRPQQRFTISPESASQSALTALHNQPWQRFTIGPDSASQSAPKAGIFQTTVEKMSWTLSLRNLDLTNA